MAKSVGANQVEKLQAVAMLKAGASFAEVVERFSNVESEYWHRNEGELYQMAGVKPASEKPARSK